MPHVDLIGRIYRFQDARHRHYPSSYLSFPPIIQSGTEYMDDGMTAHSASGESGDPICRDVDHMTKAPASR